MEKVEKVEKKRKKKDNVIDATSTYEGIRAGGARID